MQYVCLSVAEHMKHMDEKIAPLLLERKELDEEEMEKLGKRDKESYPCHVYMYSM